MRVGIGGAIGVRISRYRVRGGPLRSFHAPSARAAAPRTAPRVRRGGGGRGRAAAPHFARVRAIAQCADWSHHGSHKELLIPRRFDHTR